MSSSIFHSVYNSFSPYKQKETDAWFANMAILDITGDIAKNIQDEKQIEETVFEQFWDAILNDFNSGALQCDTCYDGQCKVFRLKGPQSKVHPNTILFTLTNEKDLKEIIKDVMGYSDPNNAWIGFWSNLLTEQDRIDLLSTAGFHYKKEIIWAYFDSVNGETGSLDDPLKNKKADESCIALGLPTEWNKYNFGERLWKIKLKFDISRLRHIPTITDAGWNRWFQPSDEPKGIAKWGWTRPVGSSRGNKGMPEIIFYGWTVGKEQGAFFILPEDIGVR